MADERLDPDLVPQKMGEDQNIMPATADYYPSNIVGACSKCKMVCTVDFPVTFDFTKGDRIMEGKPIEAECPNCQEVTEFIPAPKDMELLMEIQRKLLASEGIITID